MACDSGHDYWDLAQSIQWPTGDSLKKMKGLSECLVEEVTVEHDLGLDNRSLDDTRRESRRRQ